MHACIFTPEDAEGFSARELAEMDAAYARLSARHERAAGARPDAAEHERRHRQVAAGEDREAPSPIGAMALCGSLGARDFGPDREGLRADGSVLGGGEVIAVEVEEVVDLVVGGEEPLRLAG